MTKKELNLNKLDFSLTKNGKTMQKGNSSNMIFSFDKIISYLSRFYTLKIGDLIFTGTPSGVGRVNKGDELKGYINNNEMLKVIVK